MGAFSFGLQGGVSGAQMSTWSVTCRVSPDPGGGIDVIALLFLERVRRSFGDFGGNFWGEPHSFWSSLIGNLLGITKEGSGRGSLREVVSELFDAPATS